ncbi:MAG TPA: FmdB family zinc ribbon protein [Bryobacteraceae bacterium]|jgi:putative FmdB family regulatory protein
MPLYEYQCENCGDVFEIIQKFVDTPLTVHEKCGGPVHRLLSAPALMFKGSGWYVNDYAKGANNAANGGSKKGESSDHSSSSSDTKEASSAKSDSGSKTKSSESSTSSTTPAAASTSSSDKK